MPRLFRNTAKRIALAAQGFANAPVKDGRGDQVPLLSAALAAPVA